MGTTDEETRDRLLGRPPGHSRQLRHRLRARREARGLSARQVADRVAEHLGIDHISVQSIYDWEKFKSHPPIDRFAAWARVLDMRLIVELDDNEAGRHATLLRHEESTSAALLLDAVPSPAKRAAVLQMLRGLLS